MDSEKDTFKTVIMFYKQVESLNSLLYLLKACKYDIIKLV